MILNRTVVSDIIHQKLGITSKNCNVSLVNNGTVRIYKAHCEHGDDYYFVAAVNYDRNEEGKMEWGLMDNQIQIYMISKDYLKDYLNKHKGRNNDLFAFDFQEACKLVWSEEKGVIVEIVSPALKAEIKERYTTILAGDDIILPSGLSLRTHACIQLKVPETSYEWLNVLIEKSRKYNNERN